MSYKCTLTFLNKVERKKRIIDMYSVALYTKNVECFCIVLMWMFEFICSYYYIDTDEDINLKRIQKECLLDDSSRRLLVFWAQFRNEIAHCIFPLNYSSVERLSDCEPTFLQILRKIAQHLKKYLDSVATVLLHRQTILVKLMHFRKRSIIYGQR